MSLSQTLTWSDGGGATSFNVWFNGVFIGNQPGTSNAQSGLLNSTTYSWRIDSVNACGTTTGDTWVFTTPPLNALATAWAAQVVTNGGAAPSGGSVSALSDFCDALDAASLTSKMVAVNCFAPDSLTAALTPVIHNFGYVLWDNASNAFGPADITVNGLQADGAVHSKHLLTGIIPSACVTDSSASIIHYCTEAGSTISARMGAADANGALRFAWYNAAGLGDYFCCLDSADQFGTGNTAGYFLGYICGSKTTSSIRNIYKANSTTPHSSAGSNNAADAKTPPAIELYCFVSNENGTFSSANCYPGTLSFVAVATGLSAADSLALYNAVQAMRVALGGGWT
jgi:hypothetical protein